MTCGRRMVPASPNSGETPALHPARETRARPFHGFWVVAAATMDDCYKKGLASMGPRPSGRGNAVTGATINLLNLLQWGRGHVAAETI